MVNELILNIVKNKKNGQLNIAIPKKKIDFIPKDPKKIRIKEFEFFD